MGPLHFESLGSERFLSCPTTAEAYFQLQKCIDIERVPFNQINFALTTKIKENTTSKSIYVDTDFYKNLYASPFYIMETQKILSLNRKP